VPPPFPCIQSLHPAVARLPARPRTGEPARGRSSGPAPPRSLPPFAPLRSGPASHCSTRTPTGE